LVVVVVVVARATRLAAAALRVCNTTRRAAQALRSTGNQAVILYGRRSYSKAQNLEPHARGACQLVRQSIQ